MPWDLPWDIPRDKCSQHGSHPRLFLVTRHVVAPMGVFVAVCPTRYRMGFHYFPPPHSPWVTPLVAPWDMTYNRIPHGMHYWVFHGSPREVHDVLHHGHSVIQTYSYPMMPIFAHGVPFGTPNGSTRGTHPWSSTWNTPWGILHLCIPRGKCRGVPRAVPHGVDNKRWCPMGYVIGHLVL